MDEARAVPIEIIADRLGLDLKRLGRSLRGQCPIHHGEGRNFSIVPGEGYRCWTCGATGDGIALWMELRGVSFVDAVTQLAPA